MALDSIRFRETKENKKDSEDLSKLSYEELYKSVYGIDGVWLKDYEHQEIDKDPFSSPVPDSEPEDELNFDDLPLPPDIDDFESKDASMDFDQLPSPPPLETSDNEEFVTPEDVAKAQADFNALLESMLGYGENHDENTSENEMGGRSR